MANRIDYERSDLSVRAAALAVALLSTVIVLVGIALWLLQRDFQQRPPTAPSTATVTVPQGQLAPQLQLSPPQDLSELKAREAGILNSGAWVDRERGIVRVPIDRAMDALAESGWPEGAPSEEAP